MILKTDIISFDIEIQWAILIVSPARNGDTMDSSSSASTEISC